MRHTFLAVAALVLLGLPSAASADSLAFTKDHDVWLANPDGTGVYRVTTDGTAVLPYRSPSQADDGTIVAGHGREIVRMRQNGEIITRFEPAPTKDSTGAPIDEVPQDVAVSPDGSRIAFTYVRPSCPVAASCGVRQVLMYSRADRRTPVSVYGQQTNRRNPSWVGNDRILLFGGAGAQVSLDAPGGGDDDAVHWFDDDAREDLDDGELSRQGDRLAVLRSYGSNLHLAILHVDSVGGAVQPACFSGTDATLASPSWSPDGGSLAFADAAGIEVLPLSTVTAGVCAAAASSRVVIPGGAEPDWGPANVDPGPRTGPAGKPTVRVKPDTGTTLRSALKHGLVLRLVVSGPGRIQVRGTAAGTRVASGAVTAKGAGTVAVRLRFAAGRASRLRSKRSLRLRADATFRPTGGRPIHAARTITLRR
jgi:hypothetical protein